MTKTNYLGTASSLLLVFGLFSGTASAQSTDPDGPTVLTQSTVQWNNPGNSSTVVYYYTFTAGPGVLKVTADQKSGGITAMPKLTWELLDANSNGIATEDFYQVTTSERKVKDIRFTRRQKVILKVTAGEDVMNYKFQFAGAATFAAESIPELVGDVSTQSTQQICMPRNGIIIMTMKDGKKAKVDLSKVQKIEIQ